MRMSSLDTWQKFMQITFSPCAAEANPATAARERRKDDIRIVLSSLKSVHRTRCGVRFWLYFSNSGKNTQVVALRGGETGMLPRLSSELLNGLSRRSGNARTVARPILSPSAPRQVASLSQPCLGDRLWLRAKPLLRREGRSASRASPSLLRPALEIRLGFAKDSRSTRSTPLRYRMNWREANYQLSTTNYSIFREACGAGVFVSGEGRFASQQKKRWMVLPSTTRSS